mmetsp:Transcript_10015/g.28708  ORF Transcript_10015/g.28708 Transcript_10015/m.28708 type:complete len:222 (-) Transcript_10015:57-722(-)
MRMRDRYYGSSAGPSGRCGPCDCSCAGRAHSRTGRWRRPSHCAGARTLRAPRGPSPPWPRHYCARACAGTSARSPSPRCSVSPSSPCALDVSSCGLFRSCSTASLSDARREGVTTPPRPPRTRPTGAGPLWVPWPRPASPSPGARGRPGSLQATRPWTCCWALGWSAPSEPAASSTSRSQARSPSCWRPAARPTCGSGWSGTAARRWPPRQPQHRDWRRRG